MIGKTHSYTVEMNRVILTKYMLAIYNVSFSTIKCYNSSELTCFEL
jgi:hypothetical protein